MGYMRSADAPDWNRDSRHSREEASSPRGPVSRAELASRRKQRQEDADDSAPNRSLSRMDTVATKGSVLTYERPAFPERPARDRPVIRDNRNNKSTNCFISGRDHKIPE